MFPRTRPSHFQQNQRGSMLVISLFVIVVMGLLVLTLIRLLSASSDTLIYEVYGLRAHQAAKSGLELKLTEVFPLCPPDSVNPVCTDGSRNLPSACDAHPELCKDYRTAVSAAVAALQTPATAATTSLPAPAPVKPVMRLPPARCR